MSKKIAWDMLMDLAGKETDQRIEALARALQTQQEAENKLQMLEKFYEDYLSASANSARQGLTAEELRNQQAFLERLNSAILQQRKVVASSMRQADNRRSDWQSSTMKLKSYGVLSKRVETQATQQAGRQEQKLLDEISARSVSTGNPLNSTSKE